MANRGRSQRRRGKRAEYKIRDLLRSKGIKAERVPLSGASWLKGDVVAEIKGKQVAFEIKNRKTMPKAWKSVFIGDWIDIGNGLAWCGELEEWLRDYEALCDEAQWDATAVAKMELPKTLKTLLDQADRENAVLVITLPYNRGNYVIARKEMML
jgi:hypothetical protein